MTWREQLEPASFRGVPFEVESGEDSFGKRAEVHEYPKRNEPYVEELGSKAKSGTFDAFVIGDNCRDQRDNLLAALEKDGPGELVHPHYGRISVIFQDVSVRFDRTEGGMYRFTLGFVRAGELKYPSAIASTQSQVAIAADALETAASEGFEEVFSVDGLPSIASESAVNELSNILAILETGLSAAVLISGDPLGELSEELGAIIQTPLTLAKRVFGLFDKSEAVVTNVSSLTNDHLINFLNINSVISLIGSFTHNTNNTGTPTRKAIVRNKNALNAVTRQALITQSAGMISQAELPVYDDAVEIKKSLLDVIDDELLLAPDSVYVPLETLRARVNADINARIQNAARIQVIKPTEIQPALVLAYDLYADTSREDEIVTRNKLRHPGFVPTDDIRVLSV
ncbi:MAG: DNA circularization protein [Methylophilaceae bacterium]